MYDDGRNDIRSEQDDDYSDVPYYGICYSKSGRKAWLRRHDNSSDLYGETITPRLPAKEAEARLAALVAKEK